MLIRLFGFLLYRKNLDITLFSDSETLLSGLRLLKLYRLLKFRSHAAGLHVFLLLFLLQWYLYSVFAVAYMQTVWRTSVSL